MNLFTLLVSLCAYADFAFAMVRYFRQPQPRQALTVWVAAAGLASFFWQAWGLYHAPALPWRAAAACLQYAAAWALFRWTLASLGPRRLSALGQNDTPDFLQRRGPYAWLRHPFYASYLLAWLAGWTATGDPLQLLPAFVMGATYSWAARLEERKFQRSPLAPDYAAYRAEVAALFPLLTTRHIRSLGRYWFGATNADIL